MGRPSVEFHPAAIEEARKARAWYFERHPDLGAAFLEELGHAVVQIEASPQRWPAFLRGTRRYLMHRFPYMLVHRVTHSVIQVLAVAHARRRPGYWRARGT